jgi:hypothetical protein
VEVVEETLLL